MTRFARAKGSKSSNERIPEQATSWSEMKQQLLEKNKAIDESKKRKEAIDQRNANYKTFLEEKEESESKKISWADFPGNPKTKPAGKKLNKKTKVVNKGEPSITNNETLQSQADEDSSGDEEFSLLKAKVDQALNQQNNGQNKPDSDSDAPPEEDSVKKEIIAPVIKIKKPKQKKVIKIVVDNKHEETQIENNKEESSKTKKKRKGSEGEVNMNKKLKGDNVEKGVKNKKGKLISDGNQKKIVKENLTEKDLRKIEKKKQKRLRQLEKKKRVKAELKKQNEIKIEQNNDDKIHKDQIPDKSGIQSSSDTYLNKNKGIDKKMSGDVITPKKKAKVKPKEESRRKPFLPHKLFINGKELEIEYVDGFPVKKEDAQRLKKLRKEMISKGLPRSEINIALKLERRKAEKAFTREKKKVRID